MRMSARSPALRTGPLSGVRTRRQIALFGLGGVVLELVIAYTALGGLARVDAENESVGRIEVAQSFVQDADQLHDALHADVLQALVFGDGPVAVPGGSTETVRAHAAAFLQNLRQARTVALPTDLSTAVRGLWPVQERYAAAAEQLVGLAGRDPAAAHAGLAAFTATFTELEGAQADLARRLEVTASDLESRAGDEERAVRLRVGEASLAAVLGLLVLTWSLQRLGRALSTLAARERGVAETLQHSLLPDDLPDLPGVELAARYLPGGTGTEVGGDWYDVIPLRTGAVGLVMGDVAGHDLRAAAVMGQLRHALRAYVAEDLSPGQVLERLNRLTVAQSPDEMVTCVYAVLDPVARTLVVANAGHYAPLLVAPDGTVSAVEQPACPPIGAVRGTSYPDVRHDLEPGSTLLLFTDGLVERRGVPVGVGIEELAALLAAPARDLDTLCDALITGLLGDSPPTDDVALLVVRAAPRLGTHLALEWPAEPTRLVDLRRTLERWLVEAGADEVEVYEVVVACSEAATNAIEHAYGPGEAAFEVRCDFDPEDGVATIVVRDHGHWRSARGRDRGRGLQLAEGLMDQVLVRTSEAGTEVRMRRRLGGQPGSATRQVQEQVLA